MKIILKILLFIMFCCSGASAVANNIQCVGMDPKGTTINVILDWDTYSLNVNGDVLNLANVTKGINGFATQGFISTEGVLVYDSIVRETDSDNIVLYQFNAVTNGLISKVNLACHK